MPVREPAVAGTFYTAQPHVLRAELGRLMPDVSKKIHAKAVVVPHAGYMYSGDTAGKVYASIRLPSTVVMLGPNHTGSGAPFSIFSEGAWRTPLGDVEIDEKLARILLNASDHFLSDPLAHRREHSLEVQIPFLQMLKPDVKVVPIVVGTQLIRAARAVSDALTRVLQGRDVLLVASTDLNHYEAQEISERKDRSAMEAVLKLDEEDLLDRVRDEHISMCGYMPTYMVLRTAKGLGARKTELLDYHTSGAVSGDLSEVVGYAGIVIT